MGVHGGPWTSMEVHGGPWKSMDMHGNPWVSMDIHGYPWISMDFHGDPWEIRRKFQQALKMGENREKQLFMLFAFLPPYIGVSGFLV